MIFHVDLSLPGVFKKQWDSWDLKTDIPKRQNASILGISPAQVPKSAENLNIKVTQNPKWLPHSTGQRENGKMGSAMTYVGDHLS